MKRQALTVIRNFFILNLCLFLPGMFLIFGFMPDRLDVAIETEQPLSVAVNGESAGCAAGENAAPATFFFADGLDIEKLQMRLKGPQMKFTLKSIDLTRHLLFTYKLPVEELRQNEERKNGTRTVLITPSNGAMAALRFTGISLPDIPGVRPLVYGLQVLFALLSILGAFFFRYPEEQKVIVRQSTALAVVGALFFTVILPLQSIFGNRDAFGYPLPEIFPELGLWFAVTAVALFAILWLSSYGFGRTFHILFVGILVYEYLQTGVLSADNPSLNGSIIYYMKIKPALHDLIWLVSIFGAIVVAAKWIKPYLGWISLGLLVLMAASLADACGGTRQQLVSERKKKESVAPWHNTREEVVQAMKLSPKRNVIMLVLDATQSDATWDILQQNPELKEQFNGFVAFNNNIGMHEYTILGATGIASGRYCPDGLPHPKFLEEMWSTNSFIVAYDQAGLPVYAMPGEGPALANRWTAGETNGVPQGKTIRTEGGSIFFRRTKGTPYICLMARLRFRLVPFILKRWSLRVSFLGLNGLDWTVFENTLFPALSSIPLAEEDKTGLIVIPTEGCHNPIHFDKDGNRLYKNKDDYPALCGQAHFVLKSVAGFLQTLKERGVYDKSMIVITADHGNGNVPPRWPRFKNIPSLAIPMLWVKPIGSRAEFSGSDIPTSHSKIHDLMMAAKGRDLSADDISAILKTEVRQYRHGRCWDGGKLEDWFIDAEGGRVTGGHGKD